MDRYYPATLPQIKPPEDFARRAAGYAGSYRLNRHSYTTLEKAFALASAISVASTDHNTLLIILGPLPASGSRSSRTYFAASIGMTCWRSVGTPGEERAIC